VSHLKERKEKNCLNCQASLYGRYCHVCGQENLEPKETVWHLVQHFFNDITHFDGKFFATVKYLMRKPGFLSAEYVAGRRASYLNPIRLYVFTSAIFFLILFALKNPKDFVHMSSTPDGPESGKTLKELKKDSAKYSRELAHADSDDSADVRGMQIMLNMELAAVKKKYGDTTTRRFTKKDLGFLLAGNYVNADSVRESHQDHGLFGMHYDSPEAYDSAQKKLPDSLRDGWLERATAHKLIAANLEFKRDPKQYFERLAENIMHSIPKVFIVSLPFFALILNILYFRRKKQFYYVDHGIFAIHLYCATFILTMASILLWRLASIIGLGWFKFIIGVVIFALILWTIIYLYKAMRGFYRQRRFKTFLKYCLVCWLSFFVNMIIFVIFILLSVVSV
jgi:hypothetical protein